MKRCIKRKITAFFIVLGAVFIYLGVCASKAVTSIGSAKFQAEMSTASYLAIGKVIDQNLVSELFEVLKDSDGNIVMITSNGLKLNDLAKTLAEECLKSYSVLADGGVCVPLGAFTGITFLSGSGKKVNLKLVAVKSVKCQFFSTFSEAGINQTKQSLYAKIIPDCQIVAGFKKINLAAEMEVLCYENYVIGKVPKTFVNVSGGIATTENG